MKESIELQILRMHTSGGGVGTLGPKEFLVPGTLQGERVRAQVLGAGQQRAYGNLLSVVSPSPERIIPTCAHAEQCGGCTWQHWTLEGQRRHKWESVRRQLDAAGLQDIHLEAFQAPSTESGFRAKAQFMARWVKGAWVLGLFASHSHHLVPISECPVQDAVTQSVLWDVKKITKKMPQDFPLRGVLIRSNGHEALLTWLLDAHYASLHREWLAANPVENARIQGVFCNISSSSSNALLGPKTEHLAGGALLHYDLSGTRFAAGPVSFVQTHLAGAGLLVDLVRERALPRMKKFIDLYGGAGMFACALRERADEVFLVERDGPSAQDGKRNLSGWGTVICGDAAGAYPQLNGADTMLVDPPRSGLSDGVAERITSQWQPRQLIYVSCAASSLIRDMRHLLSNGYRAESIVPVDLFPFTPHVELVTDLTREV